jgi:arginine/serine-rich splicing factor 4/5/6
MATKIRPVYCGNFEYDTHQSEIERLFKEYGRMDRVDMKTGKLLLSIHVNPASDN